MSSNEEILSSAIRLINVAAKELIDRNRRSALFGPPNFDAFTFPSFSTTGDIMNEYPKIVYAGPATSAFGDALYSAGWGGLNKVPRDREILPPAALEAVRASYPAAVMSVIETVRYNIADCALPIV